VNFEGKTWENPVKAISDFFNLMRKLGKIHGLETHEIPMGIMG
jgi:hypothetical protein